MKPFARIVFSIAVPAFLLATPMTWAVDTNSTARPGGFQFDGKISRQVLENYLSRSVSMEGLLNGRGDLKDNIRMLKGEGPSHARRHMVLCNGHTPTGGL